MKKRIISLAVIALLVFALALPLLASAKQDDVQLTVLELRANGKPGGGGNVVPPNDNGLTNPDYTLLRFHWISTANYYINPTGTGYTSDQIVQVLQTSANTWDDNTAANVFAYQGVTTLSSGVRDGKDVIDFGTYSDNNVIAVTMIWSLGNKILETDLRFNTHYDWSLSGQAGKMDIQNIATHELGHWVGLADLYKNADYWLTMYGYGSTGQTTKQSLGLGDINGLQAVCGA